MFHYAKFFLSPLLTVVSACYVLQGGAYMWVGIGIVALLMLIGDNILGDDESKPPFHHSWVLDFPLYAALPVVVFLQLSLAYAVSVSLSGHDQTSLFDIVGAIMGSVLITMGNGMTAGHELIHKTQNREAVVLGRWLFALIGHADFSIDHIHGHHAQVATVNDPATARRGENVYRFFVRSSSKGHLQAWHFECMRLKKMKRSLWSWHNRMLTGYAMTVAWLGLYGAVAGAAGMVFFLIQAFFGRFILEVINYIEHYGLMRKKGEAILPQHSWNSNRRFSYIMLLGLARHSAHHENTRLPFYKLDPYQQAPLMPFGYLTSLLLALIPAVWFRIMGRELRKWDARYRG